MDSTTLYDKAHKLHYSDANYDEALILYEEIIEKYPDSADAKYAKTQIENINHMSDVRKNAYISRKENSSNDFQPSKLEPEDNIGYFSFNAMISPAIIKVLYVLGAIALIVFGIIIIADNHFYLDNPTLIGVLVILGGNIVWRLFCESLILMFRVYDKLKSINDKLEK
jgi:tetratricopeptide (TPR) repeat protein